MATTIFRNRIGSILIELGYLGQEALDEALQDQQRDRSLLGEILLRSRQVTIEQLAEAVRLQKERRLKIRFRQALSEAQEFSIAARMLSAVDSESCIRAMKQVCETFGREGRILSIAGVLVRSGAMDRAQVLAVLGHLRERACQCQACGALLNARPTAPRCPFCEGRLEPVG